MFFAYPCTSTEKNVAGGLKICAWRWPKCHYISRENYPFAAALRLMRKWVYTENI